ncbi:bifunctional phosphoglucose/phosphomannose isomerase [Caldiplasma sukawensis]
MATFFPSFYEQIISLEDQVKFKERFQITEGSYNNVIISGMGGSGVAGRLLAGFYENMPVITVDSYDLPKYAGKKSFFVAISYSGNTEETISVAKQAKERGIEVHAITSGGVLSEIADRVISVPKGLQPRQAIGFLLIPLINTLVGNVDIEGIISSVRKAREKEKEIETMARKIASDGKIPYIITWGKQAGISYRAKTQFNEISKIFAISSNLSEQNHNEIVPMLENRDMSDKFIYIFAGRINNERIRKRVDFMTKDQNLEIMKINPVCNNEIEESFYLIHYFDLLTYYVAKNRNVDPESVKSIENLKKFLSS